MILSFRDGSIADSLFRIILQKTLTLQLDTSMVTYDIKQAVIRANISTHSNELTPNDNSHVTTVYFDVDMDIAIVGLVYFAANLISFTHRSFDICTK